MTACRAIIPTFVIVVWSILAPAESQLVVTVSPPTIAATKNDPNIIINCSVSNLRNANPAQYITWTYNPTWKPSDLPDIEIFNSFKSTSSSDPVNFTVAYYEFSDPMGTPYTAADLVINVAKEGQAATYFCSLTPSTDIKQSSTFVVLDPVECPLDWTEYLEGSVVNMSCSVNYYGSLKGLNLEFRKEGVGTPEQGNITEVGTVRTLTVMKTLTVDDDNKEFVCIVSFANNKPYYNDNCSVTYYVQHLVTEIHLEPPSSIDNPRIVNVGDQINCTANGRPYPTIKWYDEAGMELFEGEELTVTEEMQSWTQPVTILCVANNSINNGVSQARVEANYTFTVDFLVMEQAGVDPWVIAVAVTVPILVLSAVGIAIFFIIRHRNKKKAEKKKPMNGSAAHHATTTSSVYSPVATGEVTYSSPSRPPPSTAPRNTGSNSGARGPPGPDSRNGVGRLDSPGYGDLGVQTYGGSTQAMNAYPTRNSLHGSNQAIGIGGVSMNPNPGGYQVRASNPVLNASINSSSRPNYPYTRSNSALNTSMSLNPNPMSGGGYGRQPSIASSSGRSHASSYNASQIPTTMGANRSQNDLSSMHGSEV